MTVLVLGASGLVGGKLWEALLREGEVVVGTYLSRDVPGLRRLDVSSPDEVHAVFEAARPEVVYLPASLTNVDYCETHPDESYRVNVIGVQNVVSCARAFGSKLVYFSSDYVFDGRGGPYREADPVRPISQYGLHKVCAEHYVTIYAPGSLIVRTTVVYGWERQGKNFVTRLITALRDGERVRVPSDQVGSPTYAPNLIEAVLDLVRQRASGVFNVVGPELAGRDEFAREAARVFGLNENLIEAVTTGDLGQAAARPLQAGLCVDKTHALSRVRLIDFQEGLRRMAAEVP